MKSHQMRELLARHVIRLTRVIAFEYGEQLAQVGLGAQLADQAGVGGDPLVFGDHRRVLAEQARVERDGVIRIHQHGCRISIGRGLFLSVAHMCITMPKAAPKDKREEVPGDTATALTSAIVLALRAPPEIMNRKSAQERRIGIPKRRVTPVSYTHLTLPTNREV